MSAPYHILASLPPGKLFCFGYGYSAQHFAAPLLAAGWQVQGTRRQVAGEGLFSFDGNTPLSQATQALAGTTAVLVSIPPDLQHGDNVLRWHLDDLYALPSLRWVGYLSTTGVYGDWQGAWVDEESPLRPASPRTRARAAAERRWLETGLPVHVFRLAGIYGAGRNVLEEVRAGTARRVHKPGQVFSRIHVDDIALSLCHSLAQPNPGRIYNVCDSHPCAPAEPVEYACQLLNVAPPPLLDWQNAGLSPMGISFYSECKRVKNERLVTELGVSLQYPDYREGLRSILEHMV